MDKQNTTNYTLEGIAESKQKLLAEIRDQQAAMGATARQLFAPIAPAATRTEGFMRSFNTGLAVFDGIMTGFKIMKKIRSYFSR